MSLELESRGIALSEVQHVRIDYGPGLNEVLREEAEFANRDYAQWADALEMSPSMFARYDTPTDLWDWRQVAAMLLGDIKGTAFLDYGCGMGEESIYFAKLGAHVTSIDISEVGIETLKRRAEHNKVDLHAYEMCCAPTSLADRSFDRIHGMGILHHVGIEAGLTEVHRLLKPGGIGVFLEPMGNAPTIERIKTFLMNKARFIGDFHDVTDFERNLTWQEIATATRRFKKSTTFPFHLLYRIKRFVPYGKWDTLKRIDHALLSLFPSLRHFAGASIIKVVK